MELNSFKNSPQKTKPNLSEMKKLGKKKTYQTANYPGSNINKRKAVLNPKISETKNKVFIFNAVSNIGNGGDFKKKGRKRETAEDKFDAIFRQSANTEQSKFPKKSKFGKTSSLFLDSDEESDIQLKEDSNDFKSNSQPIPLLSSISNSIYDFSDDKKKTKKSLNLLSKSFKPLSKNTKSIVILESKDTPSEQMHSEFDDLFDFDSEDTPLIKTSYRTNHSSTNTEKCKKQQNLNPTSNSKNNDRQKIIDPEKSSNGRAIQKKMTVSPRKRCLKTIKSPSSPINNYRNKNSLKNTDIGLKNKSNMQTKKTSSSVSVVNNTSSINSRLQKTPLSSELKQETSTKHKVYNSASYTSRPWINAIKHTVPTLESKSMPFKFLPMQSKDDVLEESPNSTMQKEKPTYTYVKRVKNYQNCLDEGEVIEFKDDMDYLLEGIQPQQSTMIRCSSVTKMAQNCKELNFRLYLRAHNVCDKVFTYLSDAKQDESLALATSLLLFMLSRDRQFEINKSTLFLLLQLIDPLGKEKSNVYNTNITDSATLPNQSGKKYKLFTSKMSGVNASNNAQNNSATRKLVEEIVDSCEDVLVSGHNISTKRLASEAFLRFNARRTPAWFKDEVRLKGGLDHIILLVNSNIEDLLKSKEEKSQQYFLGTLQRLFVILENVVKETPMNVMYLITHERAILIKKIASFLMGCTVWLKTNYESITDKTILESEDDQLPNPIYKNYDGCLLQMFKLLVYITNDNEWISSRVGEEEDILPNIISSILFTPDYLHCKHRFELQLASLALLVNLMESSPKNRITLMRMKIDGNNQILSKQDNECMQSKPVVKAIVELFESRESMADENEILGEVGSKRSRNNAQQKPSTSAISSLVPAKEQSGHWVESKEGMEWVPSETTDDSLDMLSQGSQRSTTSTEFLSQGNPEMMLTEEEKTEMKQTLDKANDHMEHSMVASYAALVLGCLIHGNHANVEPIRGYLQSNQGFVSIIAMLKKFFSFMTLMAGITPKGRKTLSVIIEDLEELTNTRKIL